MFFIALRHFIFATKTEKMQMHGKQTWYHIKVLDIFDFLCRKFTSKNFRNNAKANSKTRKRQKEESKLKAILNPEQVYKFRK